MTAADKLDEEDVEAEQRLVVPQVEYARNVIMAFGKLLKDISQDWKKLKDCLLSHIVLLSPISCNVGKGGFTEDWVVVEIDASKVAAAAVQFLQKLGL